MTGFNAARADASRRAPRFKIRTALLYRSAGEINWHDGRIENISRTGVLFHGMHSLMPNTAVEMRFALPVEVLGEPGAEVVCEGVIARVVPPISAGTTHTLAATILQYGLARNHKATTSRGSGQTEKP
jgi:hypothetical protein